MPAQIAVAQFMLARVLLCAQAAATDRDCACHEQRAPSAASCCACLPTCMLACMPAKGSQKHCHASPNAPLTAQGLPQSHLKLPLVRSRRRVCRLAACDALMRAPPPQPRQPRPPHQGMPAPLACWQPAPRHCPRHAPALWGCCNTQPRAPEAPCRQRAPASQHHVSQLPTLQHHLLQSTPRPWGLQDRLLHSPRHAHRLARTITPQGRPPLPPPPPAPSPAAPRACACPLTCPRWVPA